MEEVFFGGKISNEKNSLFGEQGCDFHIYFLSAACAGIYDILVVQSYYSIFVGVWVDGKIVSLDIIFFIPDRRSAGTSSIPPASTAPGEPQRAVFHNSAAAAVLLSENLRHVCSIFRFRKNQPYLHSKGDRSVPGRSFPAAIAAVPTTIPCGLPAEWCRLEHFCRLLYWSFRPPDIAVFLLYRKLGVC